jgi:hypothetical protein
MSEIEYIQKDKKNAFHNYSYASEQVIKETVHPLLVKHKVLFLPGSSHFESKEIETATKSGTRRSLLTSGSFGFVFYDVESGESYQGSMPAAGMDEGDKGTYKAITGAIKYILTTAFLIPTGDDPEVDDAPTRTAARALKTPSKPLSKEDEVYRQLKGKVLGETDLGVLETQKVKLMEALEKGKLTITPIQYKDILGLIDSKLKRVSLKDTKAAARQTAETDIVGQTIETE